MGRYALQKPNGARRITIYTRARELHDGKELLLHGLLGKIAFLPWLKRSAFIVFSAQWWHAISTNFNEQENEEEVMRTLFQLYIGQCVFVHKCRVVVCVNDDDSELSSIGRRTKSKQHMTR